VKNPTWPIPLKRKRSITTNKESELIEKSCMSLQERNPQGEVKEHKEKVHNVIRESFDSILYFTNSNLSLSHNFVCTSRFIKTKEANDVCGVQHATRSDGFQSNIIRRPWNVFTN
jgi:hypothetical protein